MDYIKVGSLVTYKNKLHVVIYEDYECGGNFHILDIVRIKKYTHSFVKVIRVEETDDKIKLYKCN